MGQNSKNFETVMSFWKNPELYCKLNYNSSIPHNLSNRIHGMENIHDDTYKFQDHRDTIDESTKKKKEEQTKEAQRTEKMDRKDGG